MTHWVLFRKVGRKLGSYADRLSSTAVRLPKRLLAEPVARLIGSTVIGIRNPDKVKRDKPHILILRNQFYSRKSMQISTEVMHLDNTLITSGLATFEVLTYDRDFLISPLSDLQLIEKCQEIKPDAIILSSWRMMAPQHPSIHSFKFIRERFGIPIAVIWWDTCSESFWKSLQPVIKKFDVHVIVDNPTLQYTDKKAPLFHRLLPLWPPQDENLFKPSITRDIPVSFFGQASSYRSYRTEVIEHLIEMKVPGRFSTSDRDGQVTHATYADLMGRSRISLNFSRSVTCHQLKSRVMEIMFSGALLLESENEQTSKLFVPMKDFVPFKSKEDLVDKIRYYLDHEDEMTAIAKQGRATATRHYNSSCFWRLLLGKLKLIESE